MLESLERGTGKMREEGTIRRAEMSWEVGNKQEKRRDSGGGGRKGGIGETPEMRGERAD